MISQTKAQAKTAALQKYAEEQRTKSGGNPTKFFSFFVGGINMLFARNLFGIKQVPYVATLGLMGFFCGQGAAIRFFGKPDYKETYSIEEYALLKE